VHASPHITPSFKQTSNKCTLHLCERDSNTRKLASTAELSTSVCDLPGRPARPQRRCPPAAKQVLNGFDVTAHSVLPILPLPGPLGAPDRAALKFLADQASRIFRAPEGGKGCTSSMNRLRSEENLVVNVTLDLTGKSRIGVQLCTSAQWWTAAAGHSVSTFHQVPTCICSTHDDIDVAIGGNLSNLSSETSLQVVPIVHQYGHLFVVCHKAEEVRGTPPNPEKTFESVPRVEQPGGNGHPPQSSESSLATITTFIHHYRGL
jgi:hypothetical protein